MQKTMIQKSQLMKTHVHQYYKDHIVEKKNKIIYIRILHHSFMNCQLFNKILEYTHKHGSGWIKLGHFSLS